MFLYSVWGVACSLCETREARIFFSKKEVKIVLGKERALTVMWTHAQSVIRDPKPQNRGCVLDGHLPLCPCGCVLWEPQQSVILIPSIPSVLLNVLCKEEMCLWAEVTSYFPVLCESDGISWGWHSDFYFFFCAPLFIAASSHSFSRPILSSHQSQLPFQVILHLSCALKTLEFVLNVVCSLLTWAEPLLRSSCSLQPKETPIPVPYYCLIICQGKITAFGAFFLGRKY